MEFKYFNADMTCTMISLACNSNKRVIALCKKSWLLGYKTTPLSLEECCFV